MSPVSRSRVRPERYRPSIYLLALALSVALPVGVGADEMTIQNDSVTDFSQVAIQVGFASNEQAAAWLTSPCDGDIVAVQIFWRSQTGGSGSTIGDSIVISNAGTFPVPGTLLQTMSGPLLQDGFLNEFRYLDKAGTVPLIVPVVANQVVVVSFRFDEGPPLSGPSVVTDIDGCQAGKNGILAIPPGAWFSSCALGVSGDFVIRAVVDCSTAPVVIFIDGFESGDTSAWTSTVP
ncbi:MAG TPA: hypothetical protein VF017_11765 [Thermoanaerobaculia bacterium]|nr:hypothetical protein [Thermoanaerobaculia bacterium]